MLWFPCSGAQYGIDPILRGDVVVPLFRGSVRDQSHITRSCCGPPVQGLSTGSIPYYAVMLWSPCSGAQYGINPILRGHVVVPLFRGSVRDQSHITRSCCGPPVQGLSTGSIPYYAVMLWSPCSGAQYGINPILRRDVVVPLFRGSVRDRAHITRSYCGSPVRGSVRDRSHITRSCCGSPIRGSVRDRSHITRACCGSPIRGSVRDRSNNTRSCCGSPVQGLSTGSISYYAVMLWFPCSGAQYEINPILRDHVVVPLFRGSVRDRSHITRSCCGSPVQGLSTGSIPYYAVMLWFPCSGAQYGIDLILRGHVVVPLFRGSVRDQSHITRSCCGSPVQGLSTGSIPYYAGMLWFPCSGAQYGINPILRGDVVVPLFRGSVRDRSHITRACCGSPVQGLSTGSIPYYAVMLWFPCSGAQYGIDPILRGHVVVPLFRGSVRDRSHITRSYCGSPVRGSVRDQSHITRACCGSPVQGLSTGSIPYYAVILWFPCSGAQYEINPILRGHVVVPLFRGSVRDQSHITRSYCGSPVQGLSTRLIPYYAGMLWFPCSGAQYEINPILRGHVVVPLFRGSVRDRSHITRSYCGSPVQGLSTGSIPYYAVILWFPCSGAQYEINPILRGHVVVPLFRGSVRD